MDPWREHALAATSLMGVVALARSVRLHDLHRLRAGETFGLRSSDID
jgi:hypothetical protein